MEEFDQSSVQPIKNNLSLVHCFSLLNSLQNISGFLQFLAVGVEDGLVDPLVSQPHQRLHVFGSLGEFEPIDQGEMRVSCKPGVDLNEEMKRKKKSKL